jgi:hypothetical protein
MKRHEIENLIIMYGPPVTHFKSFIEYQNYILTMTNIWEDWMNG